MPKLEFVDPHVHFYHMQHPELVYSHWQLGEPELSPTEIEASFGAMSCSPLRNCQSRCRRSIHSAPLGSGIKKLADTRLNYSVEWAEPDAS